MIAAFDHPWLGALFGDAEVAALWGAEAQLGHMLAFEAAWTRALGRCGRTDAEDALRLADAIAGFAPDIADLARGTARDGVVVPALVAQLRAGLSPAAAIHAGATSQDVVDTSLTLTLRDTGLLLGARLDALDAALAALDARFGANAMTGRTRMQAAMPIAVAERLRAWSGPLAGHARRLREATARAAEVQIGGAAGDRAALGGDADRIMRSVARDLGLAEAATSWHAARADIADVASCYSLISGTLGKIGQDVCLMAQQGIDEITLAAGGGSSAMPHKRNPVLAELLVTLARFNAVQVSAMHQVVIHEQERSGAAWALEWLVLPQMAMATGRGLAAALEMCAQISEIGRAPTDDGPGDGPETFSPA